MRYLRRTMSLATTVASVIAFAGCTSRTVAPPSTQARLTQALATGSGPLRHAYYACLLNGLAQGLPLAQIQQDCAIQTIDRASKGFGRTQIPDRPEIGVGGHDTTPFDPAS